MGAVLIGRGLRQQDGRSRLGRHVQLHLQKKGVCVEWRGRSAAVELESVDDLTREEGMLIFERERLIGV